MRTMAGDFPLQRAKSVHTLLRPVEIFECYPDPAADLSSAPEPITSPQTCLPSHQQSPAHAPLVEPVQTIPPRARKSVQPDVMQEATTKAYISPVVASPKRAYVWHDKPRSRKKTAPWASMCGSIGTMKREIKDRMLQNVLTAFKRMNSPYRYVPAVPSRARLPGANAKVEQRTNRTMTGRECRTPAKRRQCVAEKSRTRSEVTKTGGEKMHARSATIGGGTGKRRCGECLRMLCQGLSCANCPHHA